MKTAIVLLMFAAPAFAQTRPAAKPSTKALLDAAHPIAQDDEMAQKQDTLIYGDPAQPGTYLVKRVLAANKTWRPHAADRDRLITVLKGTLWIGKGDVFATDKVSPVREGGVAFLPAGSHLFALAGETDVIFHVTGTGPVKSTPTEVDAAGKPVPPQGPYPAAAVAKRRNQPADPDLLTPDEIEQMERDAAAKRKK